MTEASEDKVQLDDAKRAKARRRLLARFADPPDLGTNGKISWTREELHQR